MERLTVTPPPAAADSLTTAATLFGINTNATAPSNSSVDFHLAFDGNIQTLSTKSAPKSGPIQGLLYAPGVGPEDPCSELLAPYIPSNVTRKEDIAPFGNYSIALAPWVSVECTRSLLAASQADMPEALVFFMTDSNSTDKPPPSDNAVWNLGDNARWMEQNKFPVYAIPGPGGATLMQRLSWFSGNMTVNSDGNVDTNNTRNSTDAFAPEKRRSVRLFTFINLAKDEKKMPSLWGFILAILGTILVLSILLLLCYQIVQKKRRERLHRRIEAGDVDLEQLGLNQMKVPQEILDKLPKYIYPGVHIPRSSSPSISPRASTVQTHDAKFSDEGHGPITTISEHPNDDQHHHHNHYHHYPPPPPPPPSIRAHVPEPQPAATVENSAIAPNESTTTCNRATYRFSQSQTTCAICLDDYEAGFSVVREMPCGHIFDVDCIDTFLGQSSSLCPLCKKSVLPAGSFPIPVTNVMVHRDYIQRRAH